MSEAALNLSLDDLIKKQRERTKVCSVNFFAFIDVLKII